MKKKLISIGLSLTLVLTTVLASGISVFATETQSESQPVYFPGVPAVTDDAHIPENYHAIDLDDPASVEILQEKLTYFDCSRQLEIKISKPGYYVFSTEIYAAEKNCMITAELLDPNGKIVESTEGPTALSIVDPESGMYANVLSSMKPIHKTGTYTLQVTTANGEQAIAGFLAMYFPTSSKSSPVNVSGKGWLTFSNTSNDYSWYKVTMPKNGYITVDLDDSGSTPNKADKYSVRLYNAAKSKCLSGGSETVSKGNDYTTYYGVKKGTYYIRVYNTTADYFNLKVTRSYPTEKSGSSKSTAKRIYKGGTAKKGTVNATQSSTYGDYYYFKLTKKQRVNLSVVGKSGGYAGGLKVSIYKKGKAKAIDSFIMPKNYGTDTVRLENGNGSTYLSAGTYYIKIQKYKSGSGYYSIKWK